MEKFAAVLFLCLLFPGSAPGAESAHLTVFAAASLNGALQEVDADFARRSGTPVLDSFAASSALARQIEAGAPANIYISADTRWMDALAAKGLLSQRVALLGNTLVLIAPAAAPVPAQRIGKTFAWRSYLGSDGRLAVGDPDHVPAGIYARQSLEALGVWTMLEPRLARAEDVRGALALVERADAPLGIVYATDARLSARVKIVGRFPAASHAPIIYPAAIVKDGNGPAARNYFRFLQGAPARAVFRRFGFAEP